MAFLSCSLASWAHRVPPSRNNVTLQGFASASGSRQKRLKCVAVQEMVMEGRADAALEAVRELLPSLAEVSRVWQWFG